MHPKQIEAVLALSGIQRFEHFIKVIADREEVWGLFQDGWALAGTDDGIKTFPMWPAKEYAQLCAVQQWAGYEPKAIGLDEFMETLLPELKRDGVLLGVFLTPAGKGVTPDVDELLLALEEALDRYA